MKQVAGFWGAVIVSAILWVLIIWGISSARAESPPMMNKSSSNWVKGWEIASFVNPKNGEFSHCTLSTIYTPSNAENRKRMKADQMSLNIKLFPDTSTGFLLGSPDWKFVPNKSYLLRFNFTDEGRESYFSAKMVAEDEHYIVSEGPSDSDFFKDFMAAETVGFRIEDDYIGLFNLNDSRAATMELFSCFKRYAPGDSPTFGAGQDSQSAPTFGDGATPE